MRKLRRFIIIAAIVTAAALVLITCVNLHVRRRAAPFITGDAARCRPAPACIVPGAAVYGKGRISAVLRDRLETALALYRAGLVKKLLLTGDHGTRYYDEVRHMRDFMLARGVPRDDIFLDHAGFNTYNSMVRARKVFLVRECLVVTQRFHLPRAIYIARRAGLDARGCAADRRVYRYRARYAVREYFAAVKAFIDVTAGAGPRFLGPVIPITGSGLKTWD